MLNDRQSSMTLRRIGLLHDDLRIVIGHTAERVDHPAFYDRISFGPVDLEIAPSDGGEKNTALKTTQMVDQNNALAICHMQTGGIFRIHENSIPCGSGDRIHIVLNEGIELLSTTG